MKNRVVTVISHEGKIDLTNKQMAVMLCGKCDETLNEIHPWKIQIRTKCGAEITLYFDLEENKNLAFEVLDALMKGKSPPVTVFNAAEIHME